MKDLSICIATFNGEEFISEQLDSILNQVKAYNYEIIISDDGSSDNTEEILKSYIKNYNILFFKNKSKGIVSNFENAIKQSTGDIIFLCDQDDVWLPTKVKICMEKIKNFDLIVTDAKVVDQNLNILFESFFKLRCSKNGLLNNIYKNSFLGCCMVFKRRIVNHILPFPKNIPMHDWWIGLISCLFYKILFINTPLILYRRHDKNASMTAKKSTHSFIRIIKWRMIIIYWLIFRSLRINKG